MNFRMLVPVFYWPTALIFIDDDEVSARIISKLFNIHPAKIFPNPIKGIEYINQNVTRVSEEDEARYDLDASVESTQLSMLRNLHKKLYKENRYNEISTVIIDYDMPQINGLNAIDNIHNKKIKKILLTGVANESLAVNAFNQGKISRYIKKLSENADLTLMDYVNDLQIEYFVEQTQKILLQLPALQSVLENSFFIKFFSELCIKNNILEFYLLDEYGSFLLLDASGKFQVLIVHSDEVLDGLSHLIKGMYEIKKNDIVKIESKQKMLPYLAVELIERDKTLIGKYLMDCQKIQGTDLYYALTNDLSFLNIDINQIKFRSFK